MTREITLTRGLVTLVDETDYETLARFSWQAHHGNSGVYARRKASRMELHTPSTILMHRVILNAKPGQTIDHINGDTLDNRRSNLRICTKAENMWNSHKQRGTRSSFKGVTRFGNHPAFVARIRVHGLVIQLGSYSSETDAARAYDVAAQRHFGPFARLNFAASHE